MAPFNPDVLPANYRETYDNLSAAAKAAWCEQRLKGQIDHLFLANELMGYDFQPNPHAALFAEFLQKDRSQQKALYLLDTKTKKRMVLWPRGLFKTSAVIVEIVQLILNYPNIRILFLSGSKKLAKAQLGRVKRVFENPSAKFRQLYPEFCAEPGKKLKNSSDDEFTVPCRTLAQFAEPTLCISSAKSVKAGSHFDVIFCDDLVNEQNYQSALKLERVWEDYCAIGPLLDPSGFLFVTGTRYAFGDTYERIIEAAELEKKETGSTVWKISVKSCWIRICKTCRHPDVRHDSDLNYSQPPCRWVDKETQQACECKCFVDSGEKKVLFPLAITNRGDQIGHTVEFLESERREKGAEYFANQYENSPISKEQQRYTPELLAKQTFYHLNAIPPEAGTFMVGDLSYPGDDKRDLSVLLMVKLWMGILWVYESMAGHWDSDQVATNVLGLIMQHRPQAVWLEGFLGWEAYNNVLMAKAQQLGMQQLPVEWRKLDRRPAAKTLRTGTPLGGMKLGKLWLFAGMEHYNHLCAQLKKWPKIPTHDDFADCLGHACEAPHGAAAVPPPRAANTMDYIRALHAANLAQQEAERFGGGGTGSGLVSG
jgi:hypothetical protein